MTNPKLEKVKANIAKTKAAIEEQQAKLKGLEAQKTQLENQQIVALFRRENLNEAEFAALLRSQRAGGGVDMMSLADSRTESHTDGGREGNE